MGHWAHVKQPLSKPLIWWYHKILCEIGWNIHIRHLGRYFKDNIERTDKGSAMYYKHLNKLCKYGYNLYGDKMNRP